MQVSECFLSPLLSITAMQCTVHFTDLHMALSNQSGSEGAVLNLTSYYVNHITVTNNKFKGSVGECILVQLVFTFKHQEKMLGLI